MINELVSIVIPVYNVERYLDQCVNSVIKQTYKDLEIILVDDCSTDSSSSKCDEWCAKDNRIKVIHKIRNEGLGEARNTGLEITNGKYLLFLDSDDYITENAIEILVKTAEKEDADIVGSGEYGVNDEAQISINSLPSQYRVYRDGEVISVFLPNIIAPNPTSGEKVGFSLCLSGPLFSLRAIRKNGWKCASERWIISEDTYSFLELCKNVRCVVEVPECTMYYRSNEKSLSHTYRPDRAEKNIDFYNKCADLIKKKQLGDEVNRRLVSSYFSFLISDLKQIYSNVNNYRERIIDVIDDKRCIEILSSGDFRAESKARRLLCFCIKHHLHNIALLLISAKVKR